MDATDIFQIVSAIITIIISIIGLVQSGIANKKADESNELSRDANKIAEKANNLAEVANGTAEKALNDSQKDYMPLVRFKGQYNIVSKSIKTLRNENTFDFDKIILRLSNDFDGGYYDEDDELPCITAEIENCGNGIIKGITLNSFWMQSGNKVAMDYYSDDELDSLCNFKSKCTEWFILLPKETTIVNFIILNDIRDREDCNSINEVYTCMKEFEQDNDNIMIGMNLEIESLNGTRYEQDFLAGTFLDGKIAHNSFADAKTKKDRTA